ncbi:hypothetical protein AB0G04_10955 [Actinoplanes sp. NPDC023801]|uniref:hypothetical protein n=1 Tax=Actinoplanes sp. NPDC023801 TaxID=3154595 RepID=UPI0034055B58
MRYRYLGPPGIAARDAQPGRPVRSAAELHAFLAGSDPRDRNEPFTYVVTADGVLRLAPRRSEHVACAGGGDVLAAGEITFGTGGHVTDITNQSTGYGPDPSCWPDAAAALDAAGITHPGRFTSAFTFRHCPGCGNLSLIKDGDFSCALCEADLP